MKYLLSLEWFHFIVLGVCLLGFTKLNAQSLELDWQLKTNGKIVAGPITDEINVYVGNEKGTFQAIDLKTGKTVWEVETGGNIQAKALLIDEFVFFESANVFYLLNKKNGKEIWNYPVSMSPEKFSYKGVDYPYKLDPFDDKRSSGIFHDGVIYVGTSNGKILGLNSINGHLEFSVSTDDLAPIRATPLIYENNLYFGDWNGSVYCYDLKNKKQVWVKNTYREKPYSTFGGIASELVIYKNKLFFGARNPMLNALWVENGEKEWTYTDSDGGWIIGDPVIHNDTLYIGGSDNFSMLAFGTSDGKLLWKHKRAKNIYCKPVITKDWVIYTTGNSYNPRDTGEIVILDRITGDHIASHQITSGVFSSPVLIMNEFVVFGSNDGTVYSLKIRS